MGLAQYWRTGREERGRSGGREERREGGREGEDMVKEGRRERKTRSRRGRRYNSSEHFQKKLNHTHLNSCSKLHCKKCTMHKYFSSISTSCIKVVRMPPVAITQYCIISLSLSLLLLKCFFGLVFLPLTHLPLLQPPLELRKSQSSW